MSAEIVRVDVLPTISKKGTTSNKKDYSSNIRRERNVFNEYVKPPESMVSLNKIPRSQGQMVWILSGQGFSSGLPTI